MKKILIALGLCLPLVSFAGGKDISFIGGNSVVHQLVGKDFFVQGIVISDEVNKVMINNAIYREGDLLIGGWRINKIGDGVLYLGKGGERIKWAAFSKKKVVIEEKKEVAEEKEITENKK